MIKCRVLRIAIRCPQLAEVSLKPTLNRVRDAAVWSSQKLRRLILPRALCGSANRSNSLSTSLIFSNCAYLTDDTLREISHPCTQLPTLDASYCPNISLE